MATKELNSYPENIQTENARKQLTFVRIECVSVGAWVKLTPGFAVRRGVVREYVFTRYHLVLRIFETQKLIIGFCGALLWFRKVYNVLF